MGSEEVGRRVGPGPHGVRLSHPSAEEARHYLRSVDYANRFHYGKMFEHTGALDMVCYRLKDLVDSFETPPGRGMQFLASRDLLLNPSKLTAWVRDVVGDAALADTLDQAVVRSEPLGGQIDTVVALVRTRYRQYREALEEEGSGETWTGCKNSRR